jgi:hypothetical protein
MIVWPGLMMEVVRISETSVYFHEATWRHNPEVCHNDAYKLVDW